MPVSARSRSLLTWLPATVLLIVIGLIVLATFAVQGSWWAEEDPTASADQKAPDGSSMLTDAGFDYVNVEGVFRARIGAGAQSAAALGMGADAEKDAPLRRPVRAIVAGGEEVYLVEDVIAVAAVSRGGELASVALTLDGSAPWPDAVAGVAALAPTYGWDSRQIESLDAQLLEFNRGAGDEFEAVVGPSAGAARVSATLTFNRAGGGTSTTLTFEPAG